MAAGDDPLKDLRRLLQTAPPAVRRILCAALEALRPPPAEPPPSERPRTLH